MRVVSFHIKIYLRYHFSFVSVNRIISPVTSKDHGKLGRGKLGVRAETLLIAESISQVVSNLDMKSTRKNA